VTEHEGRALEGPTAIDRTVAFLDVLGFKALVDALPHAELVEKYRQLQLAADRATRVPVFPDDQRRFDADAFYEGSEVGRARTAHVLMASDTVVVFARADDHNATLSVLACTRALLAVGFDIGMPLRGGVARGPLELIRGSEQSSAQRPIGWFAGLVGRGLVNAYLLESQCDWSGAVVDQSVADYLHGVELLQFDDGPFTAWHQACSLGLVASANVPTKKAVGPSLREALNALVGRRSGRPRYRVEHEQWWTVPWPMAIGPLARSIGSVNGRLPTRSLRRNVNWVPANWPSETRRPRTCVPLRPRVVRDLRSGLRGCRVSHRPIWLRGRPFSGP
jgi:hypothetical protein